MTETLSDALRDGWGDQDFFGWPEPNTDCTGGGNAVFSLAAEARPPASPPVQEGLCECGHPLTEHVDSHTWGPNTICVANAGLGLEICPCVRRNNLPAAEARANGGNCLPPAGVDRSEGMATPSQPRDVPDSGARPARQGHLAGGR